MFKHFKIAYRFLLRQRQYTLVNILGLSLSLVAVFAIALYLNDELSFDRGHKNSSRIYRVIENRVDDNGEATDMGGVAFRTSALQSEVPEIEVSTKLTVIGRTLVSTDENENQFYEQYAFADQALLEVFDYKLIHGSRASALANPYSVILTKATALRFFGTDEVVGKSLKTDREEEPFTITAVMEDFPSNSHLNFNMLFSFETNVSTEWYKRFESSDWSSNYFTVYYLLDENADPDHVAQQLTSIVNGNRTDQEKKCTMWLQALKDIHFQSADIRGGYVSSFGEMSYIYIFGAVGVFILLIALVNYVNLATSLSMKRSKEIGVKKVTGANRGSLAIQFIAESIITTAVAVILALAVINILLPILNEFTGKTVQMNVLTNPPALLTILGFALVLGILAGSYPAFRLSQLKPILAMKGYGKSAQGSLMRQGLVVFQFFLSITLIIATITAYNQINFIRSKNLGFNSEQLVVADINSGKIRRGAMTVKSEIEKMSGVKSVSVSSRVPGEWKNLPQVRVTTLDNFDLSCYFIGADEDFLETYQMKLIAGSNFREDFPGDSSSIIINETAAKLLGISEPGQEVIIPSVNMAVNDELLDYPFHARVIGIVNDFNFQSLHQDIAPMVIGYYNNPIHSIDYFTIRLATTNLEGSIKKMQDIMYTIDPSHFLEHNFLDERLADFYKQDVQRSRLFALAAGVAIGLASLGLFSLASFNAEQRVKEIGVRRVLGATVLQLTTMLCSEYIKLVGIGFLLAVPISIWALDDWLSTFAYRTSVGVWVLLTACIISFAIAMLTVGYKSMKAAFANPADSLRTE